MPGLVSVVTGTSSISDASGHPVDGKLVITPLAPFEWDGLNGREKVTMKPVIALFSNGALDGPLTLAPTYNANHDTDNISYKVNYVVGSSGWYEIWTIDALGPAELEITDIVIQKSSVAPTTVISAALGKGIIAGGAAGETAIKNSGADYDMVWGPDPYARANHTGMQGASTISGLGDAATRNVGAVAGMVADGAHNHDGRYEPADAGIHLHIADTNNPHQVTTNQLSGLNTIILNGGYF